MDPSFLFRSPLLSDAENNNLMAAAAAADKARAMMMFGGMRGPAPPGPPGLFQGQPSPGFFPGAALAAALAAASSSNSGGPSNISPRMGSSPPSPSQQSQLPQMYGNSQNGQAALISQWNAVHQAAAAHQAAFAAAVSAAQGKGNFLPTSSPPMTSPGSSTSPVLRHPSSLPVGFQRFSPYVIPPHKQRSSPSPTAELMKRGSPLSHGSPSPASPSRS